jgi:hypothetical protein
MPIDNCAIVDSVNEMQLNGTVSEPNKADL